MVYIWFTPYSFVFAGVCTILDIQKASYILITYIKDRVWVVHKTVIFFSGKNGKNTSFDTNSSPRKLKKSEFYVL